jgi:hypothetical protein
MNKMKIIPMLVIAMFLSIAFPTTGTAAELEGTIDVSVSGFIGLVTPIINLTETQGVSFVVNITESEGNYTYQVEDNLTIELRYVNENSRSIPFIWKRSLGYSALLIRDKNFIEKKPIIGYLRRLIPVHPLLKSVPVVNSTLFKSRAEKLVIPVKYTITASVWENSTLGVYENMTFYINTMGLLPGDVDGMSQKVPILDLKKVNLTVAYVAPFSQK